MATQVVELTGDEADLLRSLDRAVKKQLEYENKLRETGKTGDAAGTQIEAALSRVERESNKALKGMMTELRGLGPQGTAAADALKKHLVDAGKAGYQSIDTVLDRIKKIDPEAASAAKSMSDDFKRSAEESESAWDKFGDGVGEKLGGIAVAWTAVSVAIQLANGYLEHHRELVAEARDSHLTLAGAQQEAYKNLVGFTKAEQKQLLEQDAAAIQRATAFPDRKQIVNAIGAAGSADAAFADIVPMVTAAAEITKLSPDQIDEYTMGAFNIGKVTGGSAVDSLNLLLTAGGKALVKDPRDVAETLPAAILSANNYAPAGDAATNAREAAALYGLSTDVGGDVTGKSSQTNVVTVSEYLAQLFKEGNKGLNTDIGNAQKAFEKQQAKVAELEQTSGVDSKAKQELAAKEAQIAKMRQAAGAASDDSALTRERADLAEMQQRITRPKKPLTAAERTKAQKAVDQQAAKIRQMEAGNAAKGSLLGAEAELKKLRESVSSQKNDAKIEKEKAELATMKAELDKLQARIDSLPKDPGTLFGRIVAMQGSEELRKQYLAFEGGIKGEKQFLASNQALADPNSPAFQKLQSKFDGITGGREAYDKTVDQINNGTLSTRIAANEAADQARAQQSELDRTDMSLLGQVRKVAQSAFQDNQTGIDAAIETIGDWLPMGRSIETGRLEGATAAEEAVSAIRELGILRSNVSDPQKKENITQAMDNLAELITSSAKDLEAGGAAKARNRILNPYEYAGDQQTEELLQRIAITLEKIAQSSDSTAVNTGKQPSVTAGLGADGT